MSATLQIDLDTAAYGSEIGARLHLLTTPLAQVDADIVLAQSVVTHVYNATLDVADYPAGYYRCDIYRSAAAVLGTFLASGYVWIVDGQICNVQPVDLSAINSQVESIASDVTTLRALSSLSTPLPAGFVELTSDLVIGDDYTTTTDRLIVVQLVDSAGDPIAVTYGSLTLADAGISIQMLFKPSGRSTGVATLTGTCTYTPASGETPAFLSVSLPRTETANAIPSSYDIQVEAKWTSGEIVTLFPFGKAEFVKDIQRAA